jgi:hypothetical protein
MRLLSTRVHGILDYAVGTLLIVAPALFGIEHGTAIWILVILGAGAIVYSLLTRYELGLVGIIPMPVHLWIDIGSGILLLLSPFLLGFSGVVWFPHVLFGLLEIGVASVTRREPAM